MKQTIFPRQVTFFSFLFLLTSFCFAQTQTQMNVDANAKYMKSDKKLNDIYQKILVEYKTDTAFIKNLKISQRLWVNFRDAELKVKYPDGQFFGSVNPMCRSSYLESMTQDRIRTLKVWLDGIEEGDVCTGTVKRKK